MTLPEHVLLHETWVKAPPVLQPHISLGAALAVIWLSPVPLATALEILA